MYGLIMFLLVLILLMAGFPVAFTFAGVALLSGFIIFGLEDSISLFSLMPYRIDESLMQNKILMAIPLFIFMGIVLQKTKMAERLLESMGSLFGPIRGGIAISAILVGALLAATTGVVGASVVAMGIIALPVMLKNKYNTELACGTICASGTLGQIIPPSIILIILGDVLNQPVGDLFKAAVLPGGLLIIVYIIYIVIISYINKDYAPPIVTSHTTKVVIIKSLKAIVPPLVLIIIVLGSIFAGIATPTESAAVGGVGAIILSFFYREFSFKMLKETALDTVKITGMVFAILVGATAFSLVFTKSGGHDLVKDLLLALPGEKWGFIIFSMIIIMLLGFFVDFIEISYIVVPILYPIALALDINMLWFGILIAMNLQTSFLTPPFGFSLFYLKGVAPDNVKTTQIYKGVTMFIVIQFLVLASIVIFPKFYGLS